MIKPGILGLGSRSTSHYIERLNLLCFKNSTATKFCPLIRFNANFNEMNNLLPYPSNSLDALVLNAFNSLISLGSTDIIIPNITLHETIDRIEHQWINRIQISHPIRLTIQHLLHNNISEIQLIASKFTVQSPWFLDQFSKANISVKLLSDEDNLWIDDFRKKVYVDRESISDKTKFQELIKTMANKQTVVIGCTELSLSLPSNLNNVIDMAEMQIQAFAKKLNHNE